MTELLSSIGKSSINNTKFIVTTFLLLLLSFSVIYFFGTPYKIIGILIVIPLVFISLANYNFVSFLLLIGLFTNSYYLNIYIVVMIPFLLLLSILIEDGRIKLPNTKLSLPILLYFTTMLFSLINSANIFLSFYLLVNFISFVLIIFLIQYLVKNADQLQLYFSLFIILNILNGAHVIITSLLTGYRVFGFAGIVFVDYSAVAILILVIKTILTSGISKLKFFPIIIFLIVALIFTQSRGALATLFITLFILYLFFVIKSEYFNFSKKRIIYYGVSTFLVISLIVGAIYLTKPEVFSRYSQFTNLDVTTVQFETDFTESSIFSRLLLWSTSLRAFETHPIIGIGAFSFPFGSAEYSKLSPYLYNNFVKGLSPHVAYLAVLVETGVLGFIAFIFLLRNIFLIAKRNVLKRFKQNYEQSNAVILLFIQLYIFISMFITDAWLWGQCGILWGISIGLLVAHNKFSNQIDVVKNEA